MKLNLMSYLPFDLTIKMVSDFVRRSQFSRGGEDRCYGGTTVEIGATEVLRWRSATVREYVFRSRDGALCSARMCCFIFLTK